MEFSTYPWCTAPFSTLGTFQSNAPNCTALAKNSPREGEFNTVLVNNDMCLLCQRRFDSAEAAIKHYKVQHLNFCNICNVSNTYCQHNATSHPKSNVSMEVSPVPSPQAATTRPGQNKRTASIVTADSSETPAACPPAKKPAFKSTSKSRKRTAMSFVNISYCRECRTNFASLNEILKHYQIEHDTNVYPCSHCHRGFLSCAGRSRHERQAHNAESANNGQEQPTQPLVNQQSVFSRHFSPYEALSSDLIKSYLTVKHSAHLGQFGIRLVNDDDVGQQTHAGFVDLTLDD